jgi:hypothetical protein
MFAEIAGAWPSYDVRKFDYSDVRDVNTRQRAMIFCVKVVLI